MKISHDIKPRNWRRIVGTIVTMSLLLSILYILGKILFAPADTFVLAVSGREKNDSLITLIKCFMGLIVMMVPSIAERKLSIDIPNGIGVMYFMFLFAAIILGDVGKMYSVISYWDTILHALSGVFLAALGFTIILFMCDSKPQPLAISPFAIAMLAFCFAMTMGCLWEIYEYTIDGMFLHNLQGYALGDGTPLCGRAALADTMEDIITNALSALLACIVGFLSFKKRFLQSDEPPQAN